jgi:hypothetical protein
MAPNATNFGPPHPTEIAVPPALRPQFSIGSILRQTFSVCGSNWGAIFILMAVPTAVTVLAEVLLVDSGSWTRSVTANLITAVTEPLAIGAIFSIVYEALHGRQTSVPMGLRAVSTNLVQVVGAWLLSILVILTGMVLCIVPGVIAVGLLALAVPVAMQEKPGVLAALRRSAALTRTYRGQVIGVLFTLGLIAVVPLIAIALIVGSAETRAWYIASAPVFIVVGGLNATATAVMYDRLRLREESSAAGIMPPLDH